MALAPPAQLQSAAQYFDCGTAELRSALEVFADTKQRWTANGANLPGKTEQVASSYRCEKGADWTCPNPSQAHQVAGALGLDNGAGGGKES